jgi:hypothetical protein
VTRSSNPDFTYTVGQLCLSAARELGAIGLGDSLDSSEEEEMVVRLNSMLAKWSLDAKLFREETATVTVGTTGQLTLDGDNSEIRDIRSVRHIQSATSHRPLAPWNRDQFFALPNRAQVSASPVAWYMSRKLGGNILYLWPVPSADVSVEVDYNRAFYFAEGPDQELDLPPEWHEAALYGLASRCAGIFNTVELDPSVVQRCDAQARSSYQAVLDTDRPDSYFFEYDSPVEVR